jgi:hypothetical protein
MKLISHRGNILGKNPEFENSPSYINMALKLGYDVEVDVWYIDGKWYLGHDEPQYENIDQSFLLNNRFWLHAKNGDAFHQLLQYKNINVFWHTDEDWVLTSKNYVWTYPNKQLYPNSVCVLPEMGYKGNIDQCYGICTDFVNQWENYYK